MRTSSGKITCSREGCARHVKARGLCSAHWQQWYRTTEAGRRYYKAYGQRPEVKARSRVNNAKAERQPKRVSAKLKERYGLDQVSYEAHLRAQNGECGICHAKLTSAFEPRSSGVKGPDPAVARVDHDHETGRVRALLCGSCNSGIGMFKENPRFCVSAASYLQRHGK